MKLFKSLRLSAGICLAMPISPLYSQQTSAFEQRVNDIMARPAFVHSRFGIELYSVESGRPVYRLKEQQLFVPGSTTKLLTEGTALQLLGPDYRFHTRVYRTGPVEGNTLNGDLVLVASGDPNLSNRIKPDDTLSFENEDHSYGGQDSKGLKGDPLLAIRELAKQIASRGIKKVSGHLGVDASLFAEGERELGTGVVISPMVVNDNLVDVVASPGLAPGEPLKLEIAPASSYVNIVNEAVTGPPSSKNTLDYKSDVLNADGTRRVVVAGNLAFGARPEMMAYRVPEPSRYAAVLLQEALKELGVSATLAPPSQTPDFHALKSDYRPDKIVAEHVSPPLKEEVKVTLKVSQNLHASMMPYLLGSILAAKSDDVGQAGFDLEHDFLMKAGLDLTAASQSDGAGGNAYFTPDFMVQYLLFMSKQKTFQEFYRALPILGKDGTLFNIQVDSPAAGHVHAKTGTYAVFDSLNRNLLVTGKGLAGYMDTKAGQHFIFALYLNNVSVSAEDPEATAKIAGEALGEIASAAYEDPPSSLP